MVFEWPAKVSHPDGKMHLMKNTIEICSKHINGKKGGLNDKWFKMLTFQLKNELNKYSRALGERERKNGMLLCGLIAVEKTYIVSMYSEQCERQRPFLHVFFNVNYNYNFFLIQPVFFHSFQFFFIFFFVFFSSFRYYVSECVWRGIVLMSDWMRGTSGLSVHIFYSIFIKWHVFMWLHYANRCAASAITVNGKTRKKRV